MSDEETSHLSNLSDGAGCTEIWEHLSEQRAAAASESEDADADDDTTADDESTAADEESEKQDAAAEVPCP